MPPPKSGRRGDRRRVDWHEQFANYRRFYGMDPLDLTMLQLYEAIRRIILISAAESGDRKNLMKAQLMAGLEERPNGTATKDW